MRYLFALIMLLAMGCSTTQEPPQETIIVDGHDLIGAMHARYSDVWYRQLRVEQEVVSHNEAGEPTRREVWTEFIELPGKVRSIAGDPAEGRGELYVDGAFHVIREGRVVQRAPWPHPVLMIGFDVYCQDPTVTATRLEDAGFDLSKLRETTWDGKRTYVVGADEGDETSAQIWIDAEHLLCERIIRPSTRGPIMDIRFTEYEPFAGAWLCTELVFYRDGVLLISERDLGHSIPEAIDPATFQPPPTAGE